MMFQAYQAGRLTDPGDSPYRAQLAFERPRGADHRWWNGLIYSHYQLLAVSRFRDVLPGRHYRRQGKVLVRLPTVRLEAIEFAAAERRLAQLLTMIEARYLPYANRLHPRLTNAEVDRWERYRDRFDATSALGVAGWSAEEVLVAAERLLRIAHRTDPNGKWSRLIKRSTFDAWDELSGDALIAMDHRLAAELLFAFYEDLASHGAAEPLAELEGIDLQPRHERLSEHDQELDQTLSSLGITPHPAVILLIEGESEEFIVRRLFDLLGLRIDHSLLRLVVMRGGDHDLTKLAAFAAAPLVGRRRGDDWDLVRPPTRLFVLLDPDGHHATADAVERKRKAIVKEIQAVVRSQGVDPSPDQLDWLVNLRTWDGGSFEFAHFTDEQLLQGIRAVAPDAGGYSDAQVMSQLGTLRRNRRDIKKLWKEWPEPRPSKVDLARELWPTIEAQTTAADLGRGEPPQIVKQVVDAFNEARAQPPGTWVLQGTPWISPLVDSPAEVDI